MAATPQSTSGAYSTDVPDMFYCWGALGDLDGDLSGKKVLVSAGVAWRNPGPKIEGKDEPMGGFRGTDGKEFQRELDEDLDDLFNVKVPNNPETLMVDSGGFQAATRWAGVGIPTPSKRTRFPYTVEQYHDWCEMIGADIVAGMDVACEPAEDIHIEGEPWPGDYHNRMLESLENQRRQLKEYYETGRDFEIMPAIQGHKLEDYQEYIARMPEYGLDGFDRYGIGTLCGRTDTDEILKIVEYCRDQFPNAELHLFGVTLNVWKDKRFLGLFDSSDTSAWHWGSESKEHQKELLKEYQQKVGSSAVVDPEQYTLV